MEQESKHNKKDRISLVIAVVLITAFATFMGYLAYVGEKRDEEQAANNPGLQELLDLGAEIAGVDFGEVRIVHEDRIYTCHRRSGKCPRFQDWP